VGQHVGAALSRARAIEETRQRNAELALINSVQEALAGELEMQAIYDVVGDKLQEIFDAQVVDIGVYDEASGLIRFPYTIERGVRFPDAPMELIGFRKQRHRHVPIADDRRARTRGGRALRQSSRALGEPVKSPCSSRSRSARSNGRHVAPEHRPRACVHASDQQLLETLAGSLSVGARERAARPRDPAAQRRAGADQQRPAGDRGELDSQAIYDLVGDRIQEVFDAQVVSISSSTRRRECCSFPYSIERGAAPRASRSRCSASAST
jgi:hypothetical protein